MISVHKGESLIALLVTLMLFSVLFLAINRWAAIQRQSAVKTYQSFLAWQLIENQQQRRFLGLVCQNEIELNQILFKIECKGEQVSVIFPMGKVTR